MLVSTIPAMNYKREVGKRIRAERDKLGISLEEQERKMLQKLGKTLPKSRVSNYEQGLRLAGPAEITLLAEFYEVPAAYLGCLDGEGNVTKEEYDLLRNYRRLPENERLSYWRRLDTLAQAYRDPLPDEKLPQAFAAPRGRTKKKAAP